MPAGFRARTPPGNGLLRLPRWVCAWVCAVACAAGCKSSDAAVHNLRELHEPDGSVSRRAGLVGHFEYSMRSAFASAPVDFLGWQDGEREGFAARKPEKAVDRPQERTRRELLKLEHLVSRGRRHAGQAVEMATWLCVDDTSVVVREIAVRMLDEAALRLGVRGVSSEPAAELAVTADDLRVVLLRLYEEFDQGDARAMERSLGEISVTTYSRAGARRALSALNGLLGSRRGLAPVRKTFDQTHDELQRRCVQLGLGAAIEDPSPLVRARAVAVLARIAPDRLLPQLQDAFAVGMPEVLAAGMSGAVEHDLVPDAERREDLVAWCELGVQTCDRFRGPARVAAAKLLERAAPRLVPGTELWTLRSEEWISWWRAHLEREQAAQAVGP